MHNLRPPKFAPKALSTVVEVCPILSPLLHVESDYLTGLAVREGCSAVQLGGWGFICRPHPPVGQCASGLNDISATSET